VVSELGVVLEGRLPQLANGRMHWGSRAALVKRVKTDAWIRMVGCRNGLQLPPAQEPRTLRITAYVCGRLYDEGNLYANAKAHEDAAVDAGWLVDDAPAWCRLEVRQVRVKTRAEQRVEVTVSLP
jgi:hypothetical protein